MAQAGGQICTRAPADTLSPQSLAVVRRCGVPHKTVTVVFEVQNEAGNCALLLWTIRSETRMLEFSLRLATTSQQLCA
jgi:hypothetical protein